MKSSCGRRWIVPVEVLVEEEEGALSHRTPALKI